MLKFLFACLLFANGALFAYQKGYLDTFISDGREPSRLTRQLNVDRIKLLAANGGAATAPAVAPTVDLPNKAEIIACTEIGNFNEADALKFENNLAHLALGERLSSRKIEEISSVIVSIPSQGSKESADKKANELRRFGIADFFIIKDEGDMQWGISLGVYKTQGAAQNRLSDLNRKGVHSARISPYSMSFNKLAFQLRNLDGATKNNIDKIMGGFPQQEIRSCM